LPFLILDVYKNGVTDMKINWKVIAAIVVSIAVVAWAISSVVPTSFSGTDLSFGVQGGPVTINNPSDAPIAAQLLGTGTRTFTVSSSAEALGGTSTRQGTGATATQLFEYALPPGASTFTILRGANVIFSTTTDTNLTATVMPRTDNEVRFIQIIAGVVIVAALFFASQSTGHQWLALLRPRQAPVPVPVVAAEATVATPTSNRGRDGRMYSNYGNEDK
jgi:hypothetical protein